MKQPTLSLKETAQKMRMPEKHIAYLIRSRRLECVIIEGKHRVTENSVDAYLGIEAGPYRLPHVFDSCTTRTCNLLRSLKHFHSLEDIAALTQTELLKIRGVGKSMVEELVNLCADHGLTVKP